MVEFKSLVAAVRHEVGRVGWLELPARAPAPLPEGLSPAAEVGIFRAVSVAEGRSVVVKPMRGTPVLRDLLREHYRGCVLVLVAAAADALPELEALPVLEPAGDAWEVRPPGQSPKRWSAEELARALRRPHPWS
jgi:hypothetical protein